MLRFKQFLIEYNILLEDKRQDFINRWMKFHKNHWSLRDYPEQSSNLIAHAMKFAKGTDEQQYLTTELLNGNYNPGEHDKVITSVLGKWRKGKEAGLFPGLKLSDFTHDSISEEFEKHSELQTTKKQIRGIEGLSKYHIGMIHSDNHKFLEVYHVSSDDVKNHEEYQRINRSLSKACTGGEHEWCVLPKANGPDLLSGYSEGHGIFFYANKHNNMVLSQGYGDPNGLVNIKNKPLHDQSETLSIKNQTSQLLSGYKKTKYDLLTGEHDNIYPIHGPLVMSPQDMDRAFQDRNYGVLKAVLTETEVPSHYIDEALNHDSATVRFAAVNNKGFGPQHMNLVIMHDDSSSVRRAAVQSPHFGPQHMDIALSDIHSSVRLAAVQSPYFGPEHMNKALDDPDSGVVRSALKNGIGAFSIDKAVNHKNNLVRQRAVDSPHFGPQHMDIALGDIDPYVRAKAVKSSHFGPQHIDKALNDSNETVRLWATQSPHFSPRHMDQALNDEEITVRLAAVKSPIFGPEHVDKALKDYHPDIRETVVQSPHFSLQHMERALNDNNYTTRLEAVKSPHFGPQHIDKVLNDSNETVRMWATQSRHFGPRHMDQALDDIDAQVRVTAVASRHFGPQHIDKALDDIDPHVRVAAVASPHFGPEHLDRALNDSSSEVRHEAVWTPHFGPEHLDKALNDEAIYVREAAELRRQRGYK